MSDEMSALFSLLQQICLRVRYEKEGIVRDKIRIDAITWHTKEKCGLYYLCYLPNSNIASFFYYEGIISK